MATSVKRDGVFGAYTEHYDDWGNKTGESREYEGLLGTYAEHTDTWGAKTGESREYEGLLGVYTEHRGSGHRGERARDARTCDDCGTNAKPAQRGTSSLGGGSSPDAISGSAYGGVLALALIIIGIGTLVDRFQLQVAPHARLPEPPHILADPLQPRAVRPNAIGADQRSRGVDQQYTPIPRPILRPNDRQSEQDVPLLAQYYARKRTEIARAYEERSARLRKANERVARELQGAYTRQPADVAAAYARRPAHVATAYARQLGDLTAGYTVRSAALGEAYRRPDANEVVSPDEFLASYSRTAKDLDGAYSQRELLRRTKGS